VNALCTLHGHGEHGHGEHGHGEHGHGERDEVLSLKLCIWCGVNNRNYQFCILLLEIAMASRAAPPIFPVILGGALRGETGVRLA